MLRVARVIRVSGTVQGVGFRPFAYRLAQRYELAGWVNNDAAGVEIHIEGDRAGIDAFAQALVREAPPAAQIVAVKAADAVVRGLASFVIRASDAHAKPTVRISPDIATCEECLRELFDPADRRCRYPYINCTNCGPRYSIVLGLPYDRARTTMAAWTMCADCRAEYDDPGNRRFHAQPIACHACGPAYVFEPRNARAQNRSAIFAHAAGAVPGAAEREDAALLEASALHGDGSLRHADAAISGAARIQPEDAVIRGDAAVVAAADALATGAIVAVKGIGGYHLACDARDPRAVTLLRERKFRKERPFAVMVRDVAVAEEIVWLEAAARALLESGARPIVLARAREDLAGVAPDNDELGVMLPYTPLHALLFASGAPEALVLTSANRSSEPIAFEDDDARVSLADIADAFLIGERPIARRVDDSVTRAEWGSPAVLRRSRGFAPQAVAHLSNRTPIIALGGDLKNAVALVVDGALIVSQHIGDLAHFPARDACAATVRDLCATHELDPAECLVAHDAHPEYFSTALAHELSAHTVAVQHHRAHVASVIAEREAWSTQVLGIACDGTGYGDDGTIWGGEFFVGSVAAGFARFAHLRPAELPGGDAATHMPVQAAAGFLVERNDLPDLEAAPFHFPARYRLARHIAERAVRTFSTTSVGRLFDVVAALCGFTRETTFEGQAAMWLEHLAQSAQARSGTAARYAFPLHERELDYRPLLGAIVEDRTAGRPVAQIAHAFHVAVADGLTAVAALRPKLPVAASGGVFQNRLLRELLHERLAERLWLSTRIPANDGGLCVGQAVLAAFAANAKGA